jgi:hypothetical protein
VLRTESFAKRGWASVLSPQSSVLFLIACLACKPSPPAPKKGAAEPQLRATVVTIQTSTEPAKKTTAHLLVIANGRARSGDELDHWRLFDLTKNNVTFVDDVEKTFRTVDVPAAMKSRGAALASAIPEGMPRATFAPTGAKKVVAGVEASQAVIRLGAYQRQLWIGNHPAIPAQLFAAMQATQPITTPLAPVARAVDEALMNVRGFPLADHAELPFGNGKLVVDKQVVKVEQRDVPQSLLNVPASYKDVTPRPTAPAASRQPAS